MNSLADVYLDNFGHGLGDQKFTIEETCGSGLTFSSLDVLADSGFEAHHVCSENQSAYDLAKTAVDQIATGRSPKSLSDINAILYATCLTCNGNMGSWQSFVDTKDVKSLMDFPASHLQSDFDMDNAFVMGVNQTACTSLLGAIRLAKSLLQTEQQFQDILCLTADRFPNGAIYEQGYNLISDGAAGCIVSKSKGAFRIIDCHQISNGAMAQANDDETAGFYFNYTHRLIQEILSNNNLDVRDVAWIVPQNTNIKAWQIMSSLLNISFDQVLMPTRTSIGHCISGDNIINLKTCNDAGKFKRGDLILMPMAGFGLNWSCILIEKEN